MDRAAERRWAHLHGCARAETYGILRLELLIWPRDCGAGVLISPSRVAQPGAECGDPFKEMHVYTHDPSQPDEPFADWERALIDPSHPAAAAQTEEDEVAAAEREEEHRRAGQILAWPRFHAVEEGGHVPDGGTVHLRDGWRDLPYAFNSGDPMDRLVGLAHQAGGLAHRLLAGVQSLLKRRDDNTRTCIVPDGDELLVTVWSTSGCFSTRSWWVQTTLQPRRDEYNELRLLPVADTVMIVRNASGAYTIYEDPESGPLGPLVGRWLIAWQGRRAVRDLMGWGQADLAPEPISVPDFLASLPPVS
ncbi:hypothetical protein ABZ897_53935 [Nonomuraea sp. NPDC046802]|uniref:hypothetical protein n=1 Tax=Nonomuraea sp. NPDC046802 TaxID=3154919 RepID=UPI0033E551E5